MYRPKLGQVQNLDELQVKLEDELMRISSEAQREAQDIRSLFTRVDLIINGNFMVNQRGAASKSQAVGVYGYDRWKGHADGLEQVVEGTGFGLPEGMVTLSWKGGGTGVVNGATGKSPITTTISAETDFSVVVPDTATEVQLAWGDTSTPFIPIPYDLELLRCQRYYEKSYDLDVTPGTATRAGMREFYGSGTGTIGSNVRFRVEKRGPPSITSYSEDGSGGATVDGVNGQGFTIGDIGSSGFRFAKAGSTDIRFHWVADAEL